MKHRARYEAEALLAKYREIRARVSDKQFFRAPEHQKTMELWCAAHFARGYARYVAPCHVLIDDNELQTDVDFDLELASGVHPFQVTEVMEPGRRRGDEYRDGTPALRDDDIETGTRQGPLWVRSALERKLAKRYSGTSRLNVLAYLNFAGRSQHYETLRNTCRDVASQFASVWLLNGNTMCCIHPNPQIGAFEGWLVIEESLVEP